MLDSPHADLYIWLSIRKITLMEMLAYLRALLSQINNVQSVSFSSTLNMLSWHVYDTPSFQDGHVWFLSLPFPLFPLVLVVTREAKTPSMLSTCSTVERHCLIYPKPWHFLATTIFVVILASINMIFLKQRHIGPSVSICHCPFLVPRWPVG